jgi:RND family efflux transporter MFP subunit
MTIDCLQMEYAVKAKAAEAEQARLKAMLASDALERAEDLFSRHLIPETTADSARTWATITEQSYLQIEADHQRLAVDFDHCTIRAPFAGYTGRKLIDVGEWVAPGTPVFELVDISHIRVRVDLPERLFGQLSIGSPVTVQSGDRGNATLTGKVIGISPNASEETHTFPVIVDVPNPDIRLAGGMLIRATLSLDNKFTGLAVSKDAIVRQGAQTMVYTIADGKAVPVPVVTTSTKGNLVAVQSDMLREGTIVVTRGNERIYPGAPVTVAGAPPAPEQAAASDPAAGQ